MKQLTPLLPIVIATILLSCAAINSASTLYSDNYDKTTDRTSVMIFPYGEVKAPGKWTNTRRNDSSGQYFFIGQDSAELAIALQPWNKYEFSYNNPEVTPGNFVRKFYEWDASYLAEHTNGQQEILVDNKEKNYLIWKLSNKEGINDYYLFALKGKTAYNIKVASNTWDEGKKVSFLQQLFGE